MNKVLFTVIATALSLQTIAQQLPPNVVMLDLPGGTFTMGNNSLTGSPDQKAAAPEHEVTLSPFSMSETEITNAQYTVFLNQALTAGLIEIVTGSAGPDLNKTLVQGTANSDYQDKVLYNLSGTRVMKDHAGGTDNDPFTEEIEPENPLNTSYIGYNSSTSQFYVKDPHSATDFDWYSMCTYKDYGSVTGITVGDDKNDFDDWANNGLQHSDELESWTLQNPEAATKLPTQTEVAEWPVTFIRWWGAHAFADFYEKTLPTEAQWEFAAKGGQDFQYSVYDGLTTSDANWNQAEGHPAKHHVREAKSGNANPFGLYNMGGNAWEWIADNYVEPYDTQSVTDPRVEDNGSTTRCWRGGSWNYHLETLQTAIRFFDQEDRGNDHFGFRIAGPATIDNRSGLLTQPINLQSNVFSQEIIVLNGNNLEYQLYNSLGQLQQSGTTQGNLIAISSELTPGFYVLSLIKAGQTFKVMKQ